MGKKKHHPPKVRPLRKQKETVEHDLCEQLSRLGLRIRDIDGDGNCLYRAIADQLWGEEERHLEVRLAVCDYLETHASRFEMFIAEEDGHSFSEHVQLMRALGTFGGHMELVAVASFYKVDIWIHQAGQQTYVINGHEEDTKSEEGNKKKKQEKLQQLHVTYHDFEHYSSVRQLINHDDTGTPDIRLSTSSLREEVGENEEERSTAVAREKRKPKMKFKGKRR